MAGWVGSGFVYYVAEATSKPTGDSVEPKRKKLRLLMNNPPSRFERVDENEMAVICKGYVPPNTQKNTRWSLSVFNEWRRPEMSG